MKNILLAIISILILNISCNNKKEFILTGKLDNNKYDGETVLLLGSTSGNVILDSTKIINKTFSFKGSADSTILQLIQINDEIPVIAFFTEIGEISLNINNENNIEVSGTPLNEKYNAYATGLKELFEESFRLSRVREQIKDTGKLDLNKHNELKQNESELFSEIEDYICNFIKENSQNVVGESVFLEDTYYISPNKIVNLLPLFSDSFKNDDRYKKIQASAINSEVSSPGKKFLNITGYDINGSKISLSDYVGKGKTVLIYFWSAWNKACKESIPEIKKVYENNKDKLVVIGVTLDSDKNEWIKGSNTEDFFWPQISNINNPDQLSLIYGVDHIPYYVIIDKNSIIQLNSKTNTEDDVKFKLEELLQ